MAEAASEAPRFPEGSGRTMVVAYMAVSGLVILLMMAFGLTMRLAQSGWIDLDPAVFYQLLTFHGTGMVGIGSLGGTAIMWYFLSRYVALRPAAMGWNLVLFLIGAVLMLIADFIGGFGGAWTFLYPLPSMSQGIWPAWAAEMHLIGLLILGVGFLVVYFEIARGLIANYGGLARALGWPLLFTGRQENVPPPVAVASAMVVIVNIPALVGGAVAIVINLINLFVPSILVDALWVKNLTYFFGHVFANATIYMAVIAVYALMPRITGRHWGTSRPFLASWTLSTTMVLIIFPHHLFMDFAMPVWVAALAQIFSYMNSFPVLIVTGLGALAIAHRSGIRWDLLSGLLLLALFGWMAGVVPAVVDATIAVNSVMHNTMWVPGHFHFYMLLGLMPLLFAMMIYLARGEDVTPRGGELWAVLYILVAFVFVAMFLAGGWDSVPRRWAVHLPEWQIWDRIATVMAACVLALATAFVVMFLARIPQLLRKA